MLSIFKFIQWKGFISPLFFINQPIKDKTLFAFTINQELDYLQSCHCSSPWTSRGMAEVGWLCGCCNEGESEVVLGGHIICFMEPLWPTCLPSMHNNLSMEQHVADGGHTSPATAFSSFEVKNSSRTPRWLSTPFYIFLEFPFTPPPGETFQWEVDKSFLVRSRAATARTLLDMDGRLF